MKKIIALVLVALLAFSMVACSSSRSSHRESSRRSEPKAKDVTGTYVCEEVLIGDEYMDAYDVFGYYFEIELKSGGVCYITLETPFEFTYELNGTTITFESNFGDGSETVSATGTLVDDVIELDLGFGMCRYVLED